LFSLFYKIKDQAFEEKNRNDLEVSFSINVEKIKHDIFLRDTVDDFMNIIFPSHLRNIPAGKFLTVQEQPYDP